MSDPLSEFDNLPRDQQLSQLAEKLRLLHEQAGVTQPDETALTASSVYVGEEKSRPVPYKLAEELGKLIGARQVLFKRAGKLVTIDPITGSCEEMNPHKFVTWVPLQGIILYRSKRNDENTGKQMLVEGELGVDLSRVILASPAFTTRLPEVEAINRVRLPAFRDALDERKDVKRKGFRKIELLPEGYDAASKSYTCIGPHWNEQLDPSEGNEWLCWLLHDFPWGDDVRSRSVFVQCFITLFCRNLYLGRAPFFMFWSNLPGSGKSKLAQMCIEPVEGPVGAPSGWNVQDKQETRKEMDAVAQAFGSYLWFDDVDRIKVVSTDLNRFISSGTWRCRVMGGNQMFMGVLRALVMMTGNGLTVDDNLMRRTLWVDLFARMKANERPKDEKRIEINDAFFQNESHMAKCLAVMWSMIRHWDDMGRPRTKQRLIEGFESWSESVGSIVEACGFQRGLAPYEAPDAGDVEGKEWKVLATALIDEYCTKRSADKAEVTMRDVIRVARLNGLFQDLLGSLEQVQRDLEDKVEMKKFRWQRVPDERVQRLPAGDDDDGEDWTETASDKMRDPNAEEKRLQAAEWTDKSMDSSWAKRFRKSAVAGQYFMGKDGRWYEFGDRGASRKSKFVLACVQR